MASHRRITRSQFLGYLNKLENGDPVHQRHFLRGANELGFDPDELLNGARREFEKKDSCRYVGCNLEVLKAWRDALEARHESARIDGASLGNSHNARVSGAMLTLRSRQQRHPQVILVEGNNVHVPTATARYAVIVENLENFLALDATLSLFPSCGLSPQWQDADVLFGSGNSVTNRLLTPVFQRYQEVGCLFDPDPGGIRMFDTLYQRGDLPGLRFLAPSDIEARLSGALCRITTAQRQELAALMERTPPIARVAALIRQYGRHLEQETYLIPARPLPEDAS